jgi:hypothetical protein
MRDTSLLRHRLHTALACLPLALGACGPAAPPPSAAAKTDAKTETKADAKTDANTDTKTDTKPEAVAAAPAAPPPSPYPARTGVDPYDPDGMEEEGCPNGDWCGPAKLADRFKTQTAEVELGCPTRLMGSANPGVKEGDRNFKGLSLNPMMQGRLRKIATAEKRQATGDDNQCCYHWFDYCSGRPLLDDELASQRAPLQPGETWLMGHVSDDRVEALPLAQRRRLAALWLDDATAEHASIASFARATLELLAVGAPPELVFAAQQASLDEVRHAQTCFTLAALYAGEAAEPGPLPAPTLRSPDLQSLACDTFIEGCIGETLAALTALRAARHCQVPAVREALTGIADDEARHAELAWATLAYAVRNGGSEVAAAVRAVAEPLRAAALAERADHTADDLPAALLLAHGRLPAAAMAEARRDAWLEILGPTLDLVLGSVTPAILDTNDTDDSLSLS